MFLEPCWNTKQPVTVLPLRCIVFRQATSEAVQAGRSQSQNMCEVLVHHTFMYALVCLRLLLTMKPSATAPMAANACLKHQLSRCPLLGYPQWQPAALARPQKLPYSEQLQAAAPPEAAGAPSLPGEMAAVLRGTDASLCC